MYRYVDDQLLPTTYEILEEVAKSGYLVGYDDYIRIVRDRLKCPSELVGNQETDE